MNLSEINLSEKSGAGSVMELEHPVTGEKLMEGKKPMTITLAGTDSKAYRRKQREMQNRRLNKLSKGRKVNFGTTDDDDCELLAACTLSWDNLSDDNGKIEYSNDAAVALYLKHAWIREQVDEFIGDRANFFTVA